MVSAHLKHRPDGVASEPPAPQTPPSPARAQPGTCLLSGPRRLCGEGRPEEAEAQGCPAPGAVVHGRPPAQGALPGEPPLLMCAGGRRG